MRCAKLWSSLVISWFADFVGCHTPSSELESGRYGGDERFMGSGDTYTVVNINITYEDEHGEIYTEISEVRFIYLKTLRDLSCAAVSSVSFR